MLHAVAARSFSTVGYGSFTVAVTLVFWLKVLLSAVLLPGFRKAVSEDSSRLRAAIALGWRWYAPLSMGIFLLFLLAIPWLSGLLDDPSLVWLLLLAALDLPLAALLLFCQAVLNGLSQYRWLAATILSYSLGRSGGALALMFLGFSAGAVLGGLALGSAMGAGVAVLAVASRLRQETTTDYPDLLRRSWMWTGAMVPSSFGRATLLSLDLWVVQALAGESESVGLYAAAFMVAQVPYLLVQGLTLSLFPKVSGALTAGATELARSVTTQAIRLTLLFLPAACVLVGVSSSEILSLLMSSDYVSAGPVLRVLFTATSLLAAALLFLTIPPAADRPRVRTASVLSILVLDAGLLALFIPAWGLLGAAWATLLAFGSGALVSLVLVFRYTRALPPLRTALRVGLGVVVMGAIGSRWEAAGLEVITKGVALGAIYLAALVATRELGAADLRDLVRALRPVARPTGAESRDAPV